MLSTQILSDAFLKFNPRRPRTVTRCPPVLSFLTCLHMDHATLNLFVYFGSIPLRPVCSTQWHRSLA